VESTLGKGSKFWFAVALPEVSLVSSPAAAPAIIGFHGPLRKILVIDEKWENRSVLVNLLAPLGFGMIEASNGLEGIEKARYWQPDLILTEMVMPVMDGLQATRAFRQMPEFQKVPIIAVSASVFEVHQQHSLEAGCNDFIAKPIRFPVLLEKLRTHLELTWVYKLAEEANNTFGKGVQSSIPQEGPSREQAAILFDLAMRGDISGILVQAKKLEHSHKHLTDFLDRIRQLAKSFDEEKICQLVEQYL
jgi:CheY-like chemotaxis protein